VLRPDLPAELDSELGGGIDGAGGAQETVTAAGLHPQRRRRASTHSDGDEIHWLRAGSWAGGARLDGARVAEL
jgi:hypothetical protein